MKVVLILLCFLISFSSYGVKLTIDKSHSSIEFSVKHLGLVPVKGRFTKFNGFAEYDAKKGMVTDVYIKIDGDSINTDNENRDAHLKGKDFFHVRNDVYDIVEANRYLEFWAKNYSLKSSKHKGGLKILKTKKKVDLNISARVMTVKNKMRLGVMAEGEINRQDFGLTWQKPVTGIKEKLAGKLVGDKVKMIVNITFVQPTK